MAEPPEPASPTDLDGRGDGDTDGRGQAAPADAPTAREAAPDAVNVASGGNTPWPRLARAGDSAERGLPAPERATADGSPQWLLWIAAQVCGFVLLLGGYFLGQAWSKAPRPGGSAGSGSEAQKPPRGGGERALAAANRALRAERGRDYQAARSIYDEMIQRQAPMPGAEYRLALLSLHQGDLSGTELHLNRSLAAGDDVADCALLSASLAGMQGNYADASARLAAAVRAEPFNARFCFCWGEALRRSGKLAEAIERLSETLDRPDNAAARELYLFKLRLARVEFGVDGPFNAEVAAHVEQPSPGGEWLLLSAAQQIGRENFSVAAEQLARAKAALPAGVFDLYAQDYLFRAQAGRPELRAVLDVPPPAISAPEDAPLQDPAAWTAAEADPAVWPPFLKAH